MRIVSLGGHVHGQDLQTVASDFLTFAHALRGHHPRALRRGQKVSFVPSPISSPILLRPMGGDLGVERLQEPLVALEPHRPPI